MAICVGVRRLDVTVIIVQMVESVLYGLVKLKSAGFSRLMSDTASVSIDGSLSISWRF